MESTILHISGSGNRKAPANHDGERFLHVLDGDVKINYGDELIVLGVGDRVYLDAAISHTLMPAGRTPARVLSVSFEPSRNGGPAKAQRPVRVAADRSAKS